MYCIRIYVFFYTFEIGRDSIAYIGMANAFLEGELFRLFQPFHITFCMYTKCHRHLGEGGERETRRCAKSCLLISSQEHTIKYVHIDSNNVPVRDIIVCGTL